MKPNYKDLLNKAMNDDIVLNYAIVCKDLHKKRAGYDEMNDDDRYENYIKSLPKEKRFISYINPFTRNYTDSNKKKDLMKEYDKKYFKKFYKLPKLICKLLINEKICLNDIQYENKLIYDFLTEIKNKNDFSNLNLYFYYEGNYLIPNGNKIKVDEYNLEEYINKMVEFEINKHLKKIDIIKDSMFRYIPKNYIMNFKGEELYQIFNRLL